jgi:hypothetical protein
VIAAATFLAQVVPIDREQAREAAERELSKQIYASSKPGFLERVIQWAQRKLAELLDQAGSVMPGGLLGLAALVTIVVFLLVMIRLRLGPLRVKDLLSDRGPAAAALTADDYREQAGNFAAAGDYREALRARFRAVIRQLEQRGVLENRLGRTAGEIAAEAGAALPPVAAQLRAGADLFNEVWYGGRPATEDVYRRMVMLDEAIMKTRQSTMAVP